MVCTNFFEAEGKDVGRIRTERGVHTGPDARKPPGCVKNHPRTRSAVGFRPFTSDKRICKVEGLYTPARESTTPGNGWRLQRLGIAGTAPDSVAAPLFLLFPLYPFLNLFTKDYQYYICCLFFYCRFLYIIFPVCIK